MPIEPLLRAFVTVFPAELPDKTMVASIVLVARYRRPVAVWSGAVLAFCVHVLLAVAAGSALSLLPDVFVKSVVAVMFLTGSALLLRAARDPRRRIEVTEQLPLTSAGGAVMGSFGLVALAEWGDLTQLATASLAAASGEPLATGLGAWLALASVAAIAATFGRQLVARMPLHRVNYVGSAVFLGLAVWTLVELAREA